jgi:hypothetical protein
MVHSSITISVANLALNDTANFFQNASFYVYNTGPSTVSYDLTHEPAGNAYPLSSTLTEFATFPFSLDTQYSTAIISPSTLTLGQGQKQLVTVSISPQSALNSSLAPIYSGFVNLTSTSGTGPALSIAYAGVATTMKHLPILRPESNFFSSVYEVNRTSYNGTIIEAFSPTKPLTYYFGTVWPTKLARVDLVSVDSSTANTVTVAGLNLVGSTIGFPQYWMARGVYASVSFNGTLADGITVATGVYKFVLRLAKLLGDFEGGEYEMYDSDLFYMNMD